MTKTSITFSISVVIPNYNGKHLLEANLPSVIEALSLVQAEKEIIVIDASKKLNIILENNVYFIFAIIMAAIPKRLADGRSALFDIIS